MISRIQKFIKIKMYRKVTNRETKANLIGTKWINLKLRPYLRNLMKTLWILQ